MDDNTNTMENTVSTEEHIMTEDEKRKAHEESEAKRKAEWLAKKQAREEADLFAWEDALCISDNEIRDKSVKIPSLQ